MPPPKGLRLAAPSSPPPQQQHQGGNNNNNNDGDEDFSPSQIPPPDETPPPLSPPSNNNNRNQQNQNDNLNLHHRKRSDVTMRAEYEMELERKHKIAVQHHQHQNSANLDGTDSSRNVFGKPGSLFSEQDATDEDQLEIARQALRAAQIRQKQIQVDVKRAKDDFERSRHEQENQNGGAGVENSYYYSENNSGHVRPTTPNKADVHIRKLDPKRLQENAKAKREQLDAQRDAARRHKSDAIYRGPEVGQVSAAANDLKNEASKICDETIAAMELAISQLREEKDQLSIRLERTEKCMKEDISRAEGELSWIDYASAEAKKMVDEANKKREDKAREEDIKNKKKLIAAEASSSNNNNSNNINNNSKKTRK